MPEVGDVYFIKNATFMAMSSPASDERSKSYVTYLELSYMAYCHFHY